MHWVYGDGPESENQMETRFPKPDVFKALASGPGPTWGFPKLGVPLKGLIGII